MKNALLLCLAGALLFGAGCSVYKDYQTGMDTPLAAGEISPKEAAKPIADAAGGLHPLAGPIVLAALTVFGSWKRGKRINAGIPSSSNPITNYWGIPGVLEKPIQNLSTVVRGLFEVGPEGSGLRRGWKVMVAGGLAALLLPILLELPGVDRLIASHSELIGLILTAGTALIAGLEKKLSTVLPLKPEGTA